MNGVATIRQLLVADSGVTTLVPSTRIAAGVMPQGTALPAISITSVASNDRNLPSPGATKHIVERVQVTILASKYPETKTILAAVRTACMDKFPTVSGLSNVTVHTDSTGPDFMNDTASIYITTQDFRVTFTR